MKSSFTKLDHIYNHSNYVYGIFAIMFWYLVSSVLIFYLPTTTLAIECLKCNQALKFNSSEMLNTTAPACTKTHKQNHLCTAMLSIEFENKNASVIFDHLSEQELIFSNRYNWTKNSITIWFDKDITTQSFQSVCSNSAICVDDVNKTYNKSKFDKYKYRLKCTLLSFFVVKNFKHVELRTKLKERLYSGHSNVYNLTCSNNQGQTIECPNGFCRLIRRDISNVDRICVSQGPSNNPSGILIQSNSMEGLNTEIMFIYACNKPMCNGVETDAYVQQLLKQYEPSPSSIAIASNITETTPSTTTISSKGNSVMVTLHHTIINFQWMLLLIMTVLWMYF